MSDIESSNQYNIAKSSELLGILPTESIVKLRKMADIERCTEFEALVGLIDLNWSKHEELYRILFD